MLLSCLRVTQSATSSWGSDLFDYLLQKIIVRLTLEFAWQTKRWPALLTGAGSIKKRRI